MGLEKDDAYIAQRFRDKETRSITWITWMLVTGTYIQAYDTAALLDTIAACGDVNRYVDSCSFAMDSFMMLHSRNVIVSSNPNLSHLQKQVYKCAKSLSSCLAHSLSRNLAADKAFNDFEPSYYLPRKVHQPYL